MPTKFKAGLKIPKKITSYFGHSELTLENDDSKEIYIISSKSPLFSQRQKSRNSSLSIRRVTSGGGTEGS
jgi:hypothetical protein